MRDRKGGNPDGRGGRKDLGGVEEGETGNQDILCECCVCVGIYFQ